MERVAVLVPSWNTLSTVSACRPSAAGGLIVLTISTPGASDSDCAMTSALSGARPGACWDATMNCARRVVTGCAGLGELVPEPAAGLWSLAFGAADAGDAAA